MAKLQQLEPAPAKALPSERLVPLWKDKRWIVEPKLDGYRYLMHYGDLPRMHLTGRRISVGTGLFSEKGLCAPMLAPRGKHSKYVVLDGEVMPPKGASFRDLAGIMNVTPEKAAARIAELGPPRYYAFDILFIDGQDVRAEPFRRRMRLLTELLARDFVGNNLVTPVVGITERKQEYYDRVVAKGGEGVILKDLDATYGSGWLKVKRYSTLDVVITGFTDAEEGITGKYKGLIGAVKVAVFTTGSQGVEVGQVSGMTDELRRELSANQKKYIGTVMEIAAQEMAKDRLRHPRFKRLRPDADPRACTMEKLLRDLKAAASSKED